MAAGALKVTHRLVDLPSYYTPSPCRKLIFLSYFLFQWLSPLGCAMFSIQLHISLNSPLGQRLPLVQHIVGAALANVLRGHEQYKVSET